jgi:biotin carboxyl carrier protein
MKYKVTIDGREREVDVMITAGGGVSVSMDGAPVDADVERVPGGLSLRLGNRVYDIAVGGKPEALHLAARTARATAEVTSERTRARQRKGGASGMAEKELRAPMPGRVVKVLVAAGAEVQAGDACIVVEAMKMENELRAPIAAKVSEVHVSEGVSVEGQALLVSFE